ncbi:MAG: hypothetical protein CFE43_08605 [Burkholderiales bacterium PBB3]|nr:MAG: hypothetical protein CFE43_08605 [Burkholderiales bacterium PBB3]
MKAAAMDIERKQEEVGPFVMKDATGKTYQIMCVVKVMREQSADSADGWGPWIVESRQFKSGRLLVNPVKDGWFELASKGTLIRPETKA